jgi:hypothetical protein
MPLSPKVKAAGQKTPRTGRFRVPWAYGQTAAKGCSKNRQVHKLAATLAISRHFLPPLPGVPISQRNLPLTIHPKLPITDCRMPLE